MRTRALGLSKGCQHGNAIGVMHDSAITVDEILRPSQPYDPVRHAALRRSLTVTLGDQLEVCFENRASALCFLQSLVALEGLSCPVSLAAECDIAESMWQGPKGHIFLSLTLLPKASTTPSVLAAALAEPLKSLRLFVGTHPCAVQLEGPLAPRMHAHVRLTQAALAALSQPGVDVSLGWQGPEPARMALPCDVWRSWAAPTNS